MSPKTAGEPVFWQLFRRRDVLITAKWLFFFRSIRLCTYFGLRVYTFMVSEPVNTCNYSVAINRIKSMFMKMLVKLEEN